MGAFISALITVLSKVLPSLLDWMVEKSKQPDRQITDEAPPPKPVRDYLVDKIVNHPGYQKRLIKNEEEEKKNV